MPKKKLSELTVVDVIGAALDQIRTQKGYTDGHYFLSVNERNDLPTPGPNVGATCAIGGVEQALWRLTGEVVTREREAAACPSNRHYGHLKHPRLVASKLYFEAMTILNRVALRSRKSWEFEEGPHQSPIEQLTFVAGHRAVVRAFKRALVEAKKEVAAA